MATPRCKYAAWLDTLDTDDRQAAEAVMYGRGSERSTAAILAAAGAPICHTGVHNHRAGVCRTCTRAAVGG